MKYYILIICATFFLRINAQQEMYLDSLHNVLFPYNTIEEQKTILKVWERDSTKSTCWGRKYRPNVEAAYEYLKVLRKSKNASILDSLNLFRIQYDSLFRLKWTTDNPSNPQRSRYLMEGFHPELLFYDKIDSAIRCLEINLKLKGKSDEEKFNYIDSYLTVIFNKTIQERNKIKHIGGLAYLFDNIDSFFPFIKIKIAEQIASNQFNRELIGFYITYLEFSQIENLDQYLISISSQFEQNSAHYFTCLVLLSNIATDEALIYLLKEKEKNDEIPLFSYLISVKLSGREEVSKYYLKYIEQLNPEHKDYNFTLKTIIRFQTPEVVDFFMQKAKEHKKDKYSLFELHLSRLLDSEIEEEQKRKIRVFLKKIKNE